MTSIGEKAFAETDLKEISLPSSVQHIAPDAFSGTPIEYAVVTKGSYAWNWCENHLKCKLVEEYDPDSIKQRYRVYEHLYITTDRIKGESLAPLVADAQKHAMEMAGSGVVKHADSGYSESVGGIGGESTDDVVTVLLNHVPYMKDCRFYGFGVVRVSIVKDYHVSTWSDQHTMYSALFGVGTMNEGETPEPVPAQGTYRREIALPAQYSLGWKIVYDENRYNYEQEIVEDALGGWKLRTYRITYEDGQAVSSELLSEVITQEAIQGTIVKGTREDPDHVEQKTVHWTETVPVTMQLELDPERYTDEDPVKISEGKPGLVQVFRHDTYRGDELISQEIYGKENLIYMVPMVYSIGAKVRENLPAEGTLDYTVKEFYDEYSPGSCSFSGSLIEDYEKDTYLIRYKNRGIHRTAFQLIYQSHLVDQWKTGEALPDIEFSTAEELAGWCSGPVFVGNDLYWIDETTGETVKNAFRTFDPAVIDNPSDQEWRVYFGNDGKALTGWQTIDGNRYYLYPYVHTGWQKMYDDYSHTGEVYGCYFDLDGILQTGIVSIDGTLYCFDESGRQNEAWTPAPGWHEAADHSFHIAEDGTLTTGEAMIDGIRCVFDARGILLEKDDDLPGDVNQDGTVDGRDAVRFMMYLAYETGDNGLVEISEKNADINRDGKADELDLLRLMRYLAGKIPNL